MIVTQSRGEMSKMDGIRKLQRLRGMISLSVDHISLHHEHVNCSITRGKFRLPGRFDKYPAVHLLICYPLASTRQYTIPLDHRPRASRRWADADATEVGMLLEIRTGTILNHVGRYYQVVAKTDEVIALKRYRKGEVPFCMKCGHRHLGVIPQVFELETGEKVYFKRKIRKRSRYVDRWVYWKRRGKIIYTKASGTSYVNKTNHDYYGVTITKAWKEGEELEVAVLEDKTFFLLQCTSSAELHMRLREKCFTEDEINQSAAEAEDLLDQHTAKKR